MVRMHSNDREDLTEATAGDIIALVGVDCASGDTFCDEDHNVTMESMFVPEPVIELAIKPAKQEDLVKMSKALNRFMKEDPTFRVFVDKESNETRIAGMGELLAENQYVERELCLLKVIYSSDTRAEIMDTVEISDETGKKLKGAVDKFAKAFA